MTTFLLFPFLSSRISGRWTPLTSPARSTWWSTRSGAHSGTAASWTLSAPSGTRPSTRCPSIPANRSSRKWSAVSVYSGKQIYEKMISGKCLFRQTDLRENDQRLVSNLSSSQANWSSIKIVPGFEDKNWAVKSWSSKLGSQMIDDKDSSQGNWSLVK